MTEHKQEQHYRLTLSDAIARYQAGDITAKGLVHFYILIKCKPGWRIRMHWETLKRVLPISKAAFYSAISRLKADGEINWESLGGVLVSISSPVCECRLQSMNADSSLQTQTQVYDPGLESMNIDSESPESLPDEKFGDRPNFLQISSNYFSIDQQQEAAVDLEKKVQEEDVDQEEVQKVIQELQELKCTPGIEINQQVKSAIADHADNVQDAIAYLKECIRSWSGHNNRQYNWTGVLVKALKEGQKPRFSSGSAPAPADSVQNHQQLPEIHPLLKAGLESGEISDLDPIYKGLWDADRNWHKQADWLALRLNEVREDG
jgi:hypothetical protein